jgi:hypothetical protein
MKTVYKLTDQNMQTYGNCQWVLNEWKETSGEGSLNGPGWLHGYSDPLIAILHNPMHANIANPRMFKADVDGTFMDENGLKCGYTRMRLIKEISPPVITAIQRVAYAILCAKKVCTDRRWNAWADAWLFGTDRSAAAAAAAADAASWASWAAWAAAARAAAAAAAARAAAAAAVADAAAAAAAAAVADAAAAAAAAVAAAVADAAAVNTNQSLDFIAIANEAVKNY